MLITDIKMIAEVRRLATSGEARNIRKSANIKAVELAELLGVTQTTLHRWETGDRTPGGSAALKWGQALSSLSRLGGDDHAA